MVILSLLTKFAKIKNTRPKVYSGTAGTSGMTGTGGIHNSACGTADTLVCWGRGGLHRSLKNYFVNNHYLLLSDYKFVYLGFKTDPDLIGRL